MKFIKNALVMMIVCAAFSMFAKQMKPKVTPVQPTPTPVIPQPAPQPVIPQPIIQPIPRPVVQPQPIKRVEALYHLVQKDALRQYDLCPLFGIGGGRYAIFDPAARTSSGKLVARFEYENVAQNAPCIVPLDPPFGDWRRTLMQLKSLDQGELHEKTGLDQALCAGHSLNNGRLMRDYALTGNKQDLRDLHDFQASANFLLNLGIDSWLNVEDVRKNIGTLRQALGVDGIDVSVVSTVSLFDSNLNKKPGFAVFDVKEFDYVQQVKSNIRQGLQKDNYVHVMIIGNEEMVEALGHYFCFVIIKAGNDIQYIVLDTSSVAYHLQQGSHNMDRLMFVIQNIEQGYSSINVANVRVRFLL